jgi:hypothetical protein
LQNIGDHRIVDTASEVARSPRGLSGEREDECESTQSAVDLEASRYITCRSVGNTCRTYAPS